MTDTPARRRGWHPHRAPARDRIITSAREILGGRGGKAPTLRAIAQAADVDPALVYYYFGNKQQLLREALQLPADTATMIDSLRRVPVEQLGEQVCRMLLQAQHVDKPAPLHAFLLASIHDVPPVGANAQGRLVPVLVARADHPAGSGVLRAQLALSVVIGTVIARDVLQLQPLASIPT